jgi:imidazole glycerol-phosphate synthase subunit HisH
LDTFSDKNPHQQDSSEISVVQRKSLVTIVDYGVGNIGALLNMYEYLGIDAVASSDANVIAEADRLILPGVGAFDMAMNTLRDRSLIAPMTHTACIRKRPTLGICLGMQLLARRSAEGTEPGLGWINADVARLTPTPESGLKVPHTGWTDIYPTKSSAIFPDKKLQERFYFVHSFHVVCDDPADRAASFTYDGEHTCAVSVNNIHGAQFHPEKSHKFGMRLLKHFAALSDA